MSGDTTTLRKDAAGGDGAANSAASSGVRAIRGLVAVDLLARTSYGLSRAPVLPIYAASLGASPALVGAIGAASTITGIVLKSPVGALSDVLGRKRLLLAGLVVFALAPFLYLAAPALPFVAALVVVRLVHGLATAIYSPVSTAAVAALAGERRGECLSWLSNAKTAGTVLGAFLGGVLLSFGAAQSAALVAGTSSTSHAPPVASAEAFTRAWLVAGVLGSAALVVGLLVARRLPNDVRGIAKGTLFGKLAAGLRDVTRDGQVLLASSCEAVQNISVGMLEQFLPLYAVFVAGCTPLEAGALYGCQLVSTIATKPLFGRLSDRRGRRTLVVLGMFACALPFAALPWFDGFGALLVLATLFGLGEALVTAASSALVADLAQERSLGAALGVFGTIGDVGHAFGPIAGGAILAALGTGAHVDASSASAFRVAFGAAAAIIALMGAWFALRSRARG